MGEAGPADDAHEVLRVFKTRAATRAYYDKLARFYDMLAERSEGPMRDNGLRKLAVADGERALEVGFGTGHCLVALARAVGPRGRVTRIELSPGMAEQAAERLAREDLARRVGLVCGDAARLPFRAETFDVAFFSFTLELFDTPEIPVVLGEVRRVLRPGGRLGVVGVSKDGEAGVTTRLYEWAHQHFPNLMDCRPIFVRESLEAAGFAIDGAQLERMWVPVEIVVGVKPSS